TTAAPKTSTTTAAPPVATYKVAPKSCVLSGGSITYTASITNQSPEPYDYVIHVVFTDTAGKQAGTATATVTRLASQKTVDFSAAGSANGASQCTVPRI